MKHDFMRHFTIIGVGTMISMLIGLFTTPIITRIINPFEYGQFSLFVMYSNIGVMILCLGLDQAFVRFYYENNSWDKKNDLLFNCLLYPIFFTLLVSFLLEIFCYLGILRFDFTYENRILLYLYTLLQVISRFSILVIRLEHNSKFYSFLSVSKKIVNILSIFSACFILKSNKKEVLIYSILISELIIVVFSITKQRVVWNFIKIKKNKCNTTSKELLTYSYPYIFSMSITTVFEALDRLTLNYYETYAQVGIYASAMSLVGIFSIIQNTFNTLWAPIAVKHYEENPEDRELYCKGNKVITVVMFIIGMSLILFKDLFVLLLGDEYREAVYVLPFLIFHPIMYTVSETTVSGLVFMKKSKMQIVVAFGSCITNLILNLILVPKLGGRGAAISTGVSYIVFFSLRTMLSNKYFYINFELKKFYIVTFVSCIYALYNTFFEFSILSIVGYIVAVLVLILLYKETVIYMLDYIRYNYRKIYICKKK